MVIVFQSIRIKRLRSIMMIMVVVVVIVKFNIQEYSGIIVRCTTTTSFVVIVALVRIVGTIKYVGRDYSNNW